jgi:hypothetical protein
MQNRSTAQFQPKIMRMFIISGVHKQDCESDLLRQVCAASTLLVPNAIQQDFQHVRRHVKVPKTVNHLHLHVPAASGGLGVEASFLQTSHKTKTSGKRGMLSHVGE